MGCRQLLVLCLILLLAVPAGAQEIADETAPPVEESEEVQPAEVVAPPVEPVLQAPMGQPLPTVVEPSPLVDQPSPPPEPVLEPSLTEVDTAAPAQVPTPTPTAPVPVVATATPASPVASPTVVATPTSCPTPSTDTILFTTDFTMPAAEAVTVVSGTVTNNSGWGVTSLNVTVGAFGSANMVKKQLAPGESTTWSLRVGGQYPTLPTQLTWLWVYPIGCVAPA